MPYDVPVLFLTFNRPQHTLVVLERLRMLQPGRLYIHCDGPRPHHADDEKNVTAVRAVIEKQIDWPCEIQTLYRTTNMGLRDGVFDAINWFFKHEPEGIIVEDDCVPDLSFFRFCQELLEHYRDDAQIMHIGGSNLAEKWTANNKDSYIFSRFSFVWGWASWRRAWEKMSINLDGLEEFSHSEMFKQFVSSRLSRHYMLDKFQVTKQRKNNSWAYAWFYSILKNNGLCIVPHKNLVQNVGVGERSATNTTTPNKNAMLRANQLDWPIVHPFQKTPNPALEQLFFYTSQKKRPRLLLWWALKKLNIR